MPVVYISVLPVIMVLIVLHVQQHVQYQLVQFAHAQIRHIMMINHQDNVSSALIQTFAKHVLEKVYVKLVLIIIILLLIMF